MFSSMLFFLGSHLKQATNLSAEGFAAQGQLFHGLPPEKTTRALFFKK